MLVVKPLVFYTIIRCQKLQEVL